ncbi:MAG: AsmA family protein [Acidobacteriaceae bacterium]
MAISRPVRVIIGVIIAIILIFIIVLLALPALVNVNQYHDKIQAELEKALGRKVMLGQMELKTFPVRVKVDNVNIAEDPNFPTGKPFATANEVDISVKLLPLLAKKIEINSIELVRPKIELVRNRQGTWNYASLGNTQTTGKQPSSGSSQQLSVGDLKLTDGSVAVTDLYQPPTAPGTVASKTAVPANQRQVYDHIDLEVKNFAPDKNFEVNLTAHLPGQGNQSIALDGNIGPLNQSNTAATPVDAKLTLNAVQIAALQQFLQSDALKGTEGVASGEVSLKNVNGNFAADGNLKLEEGKLHGVDLGYPINADFNVKGDTNSEEFHIAKMNVKLGPTPVSITGSINTKATPMIADVHVKANDASLGELARLGAAFGVAFAPGTNVAGKLNADVEAKGAVDNPALTGSVNLSNVSVSGAQIKQPVEAKQIQIAMSPSSLHADPFTVTSGGAAVNVQFTLSNYTDAKARSIDATIHANQTNLADLLSIAHAYGLSAAEGMSGTGQIALNAHVTGPLANPGALKFDGTGTLREAALTLPQLTKPVNIHNADLRFSQNTATLQNLALNVASTNATGQMAVSNFAAPHLQFTLNADKVNVGELQSLLKPQPAPDHTASKQPQTSGPLDKVSGGGQLSIGEINYQNVVLNNGKATVILDNGVVKLAPVTSQLFNGTENGTVSIDTRPAQSVIGVNATLANVDANKLLSALSSVKQIYGALNTKANISFVNVANGNPAATLNGTLDLNLKNGKVTGIDLLRELGSIAKFTGAGGGNGATNISQLSGAFNIRNGLAHTNNLKAAIDGGTLAGVGDVNLASQALNMKVTAVLGSAMSKQVGGTSVGGYLNTALANNAGELVIPVLVTGTFSAPHFQPDVQDLAQMKLKNLLPTTGNPAGMLSGFLGGGNGQKGASGVSGILGALGGKQQPQPNPNPKQQQQQPNAQDAVKGLLNQFGKKKPK